MNIEVKRLEIVSSNVRAMLVGAFNSSTFHESLTSLSIDNSWSEKSEPIKLEIFASQIFAGLSLLTTLELQNVHALNVVDKCSLKLLSDSLTTLKIKGIATEWNPGDLLSMVTMMKLSTVDLSHSNFTSINGSMFGGIADSVIFLYLQSSNIHFIDLDAFKDFKMLKRLYLQSNQIAFIDPKVFTILLTIAGFKVNLQNNKWNCVCDLVSLQEIIYSNSASLDGTTKCFAPEKFHDMPLVEADLCPEDDTTDLEETTEFVDETDTTSTESDIKATVAENTTTGSDTEVSSTTTPRPQTSPTTIPLTTFLPTSTGKIFTKGPKICLNKVVGCVKENLFRVSFYLKCVS